MAITELLFPAYKQDQESTNELRNKAPEIFSHFRDVQGLKSLFRGTIIAENGEPVGSDTGRSVLALEWDEASSFHSFYPHSPSFQTFLGSVKPFVTAPAVPELFEAGNVSTHCLSSTICQIIKGPKSEKSDNHWTEIQKIISDSEAPAPGLFYANGIEDQENNFLALIGWPSLQDYERTGKSKAIEERLQAMGAGGIIHNLAVEFSRFNL